MKCSTSLISFFFNRVSSFFSFFQRETEISVHNEYLFNVRVSTTLCVDSKGSECIGEKGKKKQGIKTERLEKDRRAIIEATFGWRT